jgi:hypothetical protein
MWYRTKLLNFVAPKCWKKKCLYRLKDKNTHFFYSTVISYQILNSKLYVFSSLYLKPIISIRININMIVMNWLYVITVLRVTVILVFIFIFMNSLNILRCVVQTQNLLCASSFSCFSTGQIKPMIIPSCLIIHI